MNIYLDEILSELKRIYPDCICMNSCIEKGKIVWSNQEGIYVHLRSDHCVITNEPIKRGDCTLFTKYPITDKVIIYIIEVKDKWYDLKDIQEKLYNTIEYLYKNVKLINEKIVIIPVLYAEKHISNARRTFGAFSIKYGAANQSIKYLKHGDNIIKAFV